jgi:hypothetical protein
MEYVVPLFGMALLLHLVFIGSVYLTARWLFFWTTSMVSAGIDRVTADSGASTRLRAYAVARGITEREAEARLSQELDRLVWWTEGLVRLPLLGPVGLDAVLGLVPLGGDALCAWLGLRLVARSLRYGLPPDVVSKLLTNVLIDALIGAVPIAGDLADIWFRSNTRNARIVRDYLASPAPGPAAPAAVSAANASRAPAV